MSKSSRSAVTNQVWGDTTVVLKDNLVDEVRGQTAHLEWQNGGLWFLMIGDVRIHLKTTSVLVETPDGKEHDGLNVPFR